MMNFIQIPVSPAGVISGHANVFLTSAAGWENLPWAGGTVAMASAAAPDRQHHREFEAHLREVERLRQEIEQLKK